MRTRLLAVAVMIWAHGTAPADPPAALGLPLGSGDISPSEPPGLTLAPSPLPPLTTAPPVMEVFAAPRSGLLPVAAPLPAGSAVLRPTLGTPGMMPSVGDPLPARPYTGYPSSFPAPSTYPPAGMTGRGGVLPPGAEVISSTAPAREVRTTGGMHGTGPCGPIREGLGQPCPEFRENPFGENLSVFFGMDGAKEPIDLGINARFGYRFHINWGLPLVEDWNLGLHLGFGYNQANNAVRVLRVIGASRDIQQTFFSAGIFHRSEMGLNWEVAWDYRADEYFESINTSQWRGLLSVNLNDRNEVGFWGTYRDRIDRAHLGALWFNVKPVNQVNLFWRHTWDMQIVTGMWAGIAEEHGRLLALLPGESAVQHPFVFGADVFVPLSDQLAIWGEAQFITPNDSGTVIATLGVAWYPWGRTTSQPRGAFAPLLPTASNASFTLDAQ